MEQWITELANGLPSLALFLIIAVTLYTLGKGADWLVDEAVILSTRWGLGKAVIGATIVSIGTTTPEAAVSVLSALQGKPGLALGNAVGSIICDTGLILGLASLIAPLPLNRQLASRLSNVQVGAGILLVLGCFRGPPQRKSSHKVALYHNSSVSSSLCYWHSISISPSDGQVPQARLLRMVKKWRQKKQVGSERSLNSLGQLLSSSSPRRF